MKSTCQGVCLDVSSGHPPGVHMWPLATFQHFSKLCNSRIALKDAKQSFLSKLVHDGPQHTAVGLVRDRLSQASRRDPSKISRDCTWLVLPYHPHFSCKALSRCIVGLENACINVGLRWLAPRISWSLGAAHLATFVANDARKKLSFA